MSAVQDLLARAHGYATEHESMRLLRTALKVRFREQGLADHLDWRRLRSHASPRGLVYVIEAEGTDRVKIGWTSRTVASRIAAMQTGCPFPLRPIVALDACCTAETDLHIMFHEHRISASTEWFYNRGPVADFIETIVAVRCWP